MEAKRITHIWRLTHHTFIPDNSTSTDDEVQGLWSEMILEQINEPVYVGFETIVRTIDQTPVCACVCFHQEKTDTMSHIRCHTSTIGYQ